MAFLFSFISNSFASSTALESICPIKPSPFISPAIILRYLLYNLSLCSFKSLPSSWSSFNSSSIFLVFPDSSSISSGLTSSSLVLAPASFLAFLSALAFSLAWSLIFLRFLLEFSIAFSFSLIFLLLSFKSSAASNLSTKSPSVLPVIKFAYILLSFLPAIFKSLPFCWSTERFSFSSTSCCL